ncbi:hypothetical protein P280DRAFT_251744 [Massarina eburnea CBS 473.64]|uniref:Uncharacterized protein n=1 Tax=Massarina eburnea CBS 473.64 TaxID=1395130 RepID=A0A6A6S8Y0_9PLEO|nr:hypothetical protein P280DRAFT_251744 [Massarina eburnea CBS 473.64]
MFGSGGDYFADLTTEPIFDHVVYNAEALLLPVNEDEDHLDNQLAIAAQESGVENPFTFLGPKMAGVLTSTAMSLESEQGSAASIRSQETQSTGVTSQPSRRQSRDSAIPQQLPMLPSPPVRARQPTLRRKLKRSSALFSRFKKDTCDCTSKSPHMDIATSQSPKLECGHSLSTYAIRIHVHEAMNREEQTAPACCGKPLPQDVLQMIMPNEDLHVVGNNALPSPDVGSLRDSGYSEDGVSSIELPRLDTEPFSTTPTLARRDTPQIDEVSFDSALAREAFKSLRAEQREQFQRVTLFESNQRKALAAHHQWSLRRLASQLESTKAERIRQHPVELERLDEFQINAEHELRKAHAAEIQNVATALKYMSAYCSGVSPTDPSLAHAVTDEDRNKLERQRLIQQKLPAKHESAIHVLRGKQERDTKNKLQKQKQELEQLDADYENDRKAEELQYIKDAGRLNTMMQTRRRRITNRWDLRFEIWRKDWENQHNTTLPGRLSHEDWPETLDDTDYNIPCSSSLAPYTQSSAYP